jgi:cytochrome b561
MQWRNSETRWGVVSIGLHWLVALGILGLILVGLLMTEMPTSLNKVKVFALHKSVGITVLSLMLLRLGWRLYAGRPRPAAVLPAWQEWAARLTHAGLYLAVFTMTLSGWLYNSASNFPLRWFNLFTLPSLSGPDPELKATALAVHQTTLWVLLALLALHIGAALKHHFVDRDATLNRMLPWRTPEK